jgi:outer membrane protein assembly factor BamB/pimeloyl-ACP methyl ester carboxylesterase
VCRGTILLVVIGIASSVRADPAAKQLPLPGETFSVRDSQAFVMLPAENARRTPQPWIWYAPTLPGLPDAHEKSMHERFLAAGIAVAGIDVGESYGSPSGRELYSEFYQELTKRRGFAPRPVMLGRSRGGLMILNWAVEHPNQVAAIVGIYPVFDLRTYPGLEKAATAYGMTGPELGERLATHNPIERVAALAKAKVPTFLIHGDSDTVVPLRENSAEFLRRYEVEGAADAVRLLVAKGQGHNYWPGFFRCQELIDFAIAHAGDEWLKFRGPDGQGRALNGRIPATWSETENLLWKLPIPGKGWSSPVISGGVCWLTTAVTTDASPARKEEILRGKLASNPLAKEMEIIDSVSLRAVSVDLESGRVLQEVELFHQLDPEPIHSLNSYSSPTPVLQNGMLYCHFGNLGTACLDTRSGKIVWKARLPLGHSVGPGSSTVVHDNLLIIPCDGTDTQSVVALDVATGREVWRTKRPPLTRDEVEMHKAFSSPLVFNDGLRDQVVIPGAQWVVSYDPRDGQPLWQVRYGEGFSNVPAPVYANGVVYICTGYMTPELLAIRVDGEGDVTKTHVAWRINKQVPAMSSPIIFENRLYMVSDQGVVTCADAKTGDVLYQKRIAGNHSASPVVVDGKLLFLSRQGDVSVLRPGSTWEELAKNHLDGQLMACPAVWRDSLVIRSDSHLYRIGSRP